MDGSVDIALDGPFDAHVSLRPLGVGPSDPTMAITPSGVWRATHTPEGPARTFVAAHNQGARVVAFGPGAGWQLERAADLVGAHDDWSTFVAHHAPIAAMRRRVPGLRLVRTHLVAPTLWLVILEQLVTGKESRACWTALVKRYGAPLPGPGPALWLPPHPDVLARLSVPRLQELGILARQARTLILAASQAARIEEAASMAAPDAAARLMALPGVGAWTAGSVMLRALGHPDAVPLGDYHIPREISWTLTGVREADDARLLELLAPYTGHRGRVIALHGAAGVAAPRRGPRMETRDWR